MVQQPVQHVGRLVAGGRHDAHAVRPVLVGDMRVEAQAGIVAVAGVDLSGSVAALGRAEDVNRRAKLTPCRGGSASKIDPPARVRGGRSPGAPARRTLDARCGATGDRMRRLRRPSPTSAPKSLYMLSFREHSA